MLGTVANPPAKRIDLRAAIINFGQDRRMHLPSHPEGVANFALANADTKDARVSTVWASLH